MIDYFIKLDYVLGYQRYQNKENAFKPEDTCQILMDVKFGNLGILSFYFVVGLFRKFGLIGNHFAMYSYLGFLILCLFWFHLKINKRIYQAPIRKNIKKMSEEQKRRYVILSYVYSLCSILLWILAFTWPVILHGTSAMVTPN